MTDKRWILVVVAMLVVPALACNFSAGVGDETPAPPLLFEDDFADPGSGWEVRECDAGSVRYQDGAYLVTSLGDGDAMWGVANRSLGDVVVEVGATQVSAPPNDNNSCGVGCRVQSDGDAY